MRRALKIIGWCVGTIAILFIGFHFLKWRYPQVFLKIWGAIVTVDGKPSSGSSLYLNRWGLLARRVPNGTELYLFAGDDESGFIWRCEAFSFSVMPGFALTSNERWRRGCMFRDQRITGHLLEFTADDGKRVRAEW